jgi:cold shock CspA family protein
MRTSGHTRASCASIRTRATASSRRARLNIYFHRGVLRDAAFDDLTEGSEVLYTLAPDAGPMGPMASSIWTIGSGHPVR